MGREGSIEWREGEGMAHSLLLAPLEMEIAAFFLAFEWLEAGGMRGEGEGMGREGSIGWREGGGMARSLPFAPLEMEIAAFFLAFGWLEAGGMRREEVFAGHEAPSEWEEAGGMRLAGLITRRLAPALFDN
jgi:hypothetical protein